MVFELYNPTRADVPELVQLGYDGYSDDPITPLMYSTPASEIMLAASTKAVLDEFGKNPNHTDLTVKDTETGKIVSLMGWDLVPEAKEDDWNVYKPGQCPQGWNEDYFQYCSKLAWQSKIDAMGKQPYIYFQALITPKQHRKRGAGSILMKALLDFQREVNLPIYLISTPLGFPLYSKFGFKEISHYELDTSALGTGETRILRGMLLPAPDSTSPPRIPQTPSSSTTTTTPINTNNITIKPLATLSDHIALLALRARAFGPNEIMALLFRDVDSHGTPASRAEKTFETVSDPRHKWLGAYDGATGKLLAVSHWYFVDDPSVEHHPYGTAGWPPGANVELGEAHFGLMGKHRATDMKGKVYAYLALLVVDVPYQGMGLGSMLLRHTLAEVDRLGWPAWVEALPAGTGLYRKFGWEVVRVVRTDLKPFGGVGVEEDVEMLRPPMGTGHQE